MKIFEYLKKCKKQNEVKEGRLCGGNLLTLITFAL